MVDADAEIAALGSAAFVGQANRQAVAPVVALPDRLAIGAVSAGVALHDATHFGVGVFLYVEQGVFHGSFLRLFGKPVLTVFKTSLAVVLALVDSDAGVAQYHAIAVLHVHHDAVFLLLGHVFQRLYLSMR